MMIPGVLAALAMVVVAVLSGEQALRFLDLPSFLLVVGGTIAAGIATSNRQQLTALVELVRGALSGRALMATPVQRLLDMASLARNRGNLALEAKLDDLADLPTFQRGLELVLIGWTPEAVQQALAEEIGLQRARLMAVPALLARMAELAPGMGLIGTLIGLVQMLGRLDDPAAIGPGMALALITTLYGAILAYVVLQPCAQRLEQLAEARLGRMRLEAMGAVSIAKGENPRHLQESLAGMAPIGSPVHA